MFDGPLEILIKRLSTLPGLGTRSARRIALHLLSAKDGKLQPLINALEHAGEAIHACDRCGNLDASNPCRLCLNPARDQQTICVVAGVADLWAIERSGYYRGQYHVLGGVLSALDGVGPDNLRIAALVERVRGGAFREVVLALSATVEGQSTVHYIQDQLAGLPVQITRPAQGVPVGGAMEYLDDSTIATALKSRARV